MRGSLVTASRKCITPHLRQNTSIRFHVPVRVCGVSIEDIEEGNAFVGFPNPGENHRTCQRGLLSHVEPPRPYCILTRGATTSAPRPMVSRCLRAYGLSGFGSPAGSLVSMDVGVGVLCRS
jgi:hypothetical protein